jgi:hypothetical protein
MARRKNRHIGSSVESFLAEEGILESSTLKAVKAAIAWQIAEEMRRQNITKSRMAERMETSRAQLDRLLNASNDVTLDMILRAANVLQKDLVVELR